MILEIIIIIIIINRFETKSKGTKAKISGTIQTKKLLYRKRTINKMKIQPTEQEKVFLNHISDKELICKIHKELNNKQQQSPHNSLKI